VSPAFFAYNKLRMKHKPLLHSTTGNVAADMIYSAIKHYESHGRKVKTVDCSTSYWRIFKSFMKSQDETLDIPNEGIQFNNILVRKGSMFQRDAIKCELWPLIETADRLLVSEGGKLITDPKLN